MELVILLVLVLIGLLMLPVLIYFTAAPVAGEYPGDGLWGLMTHIWSDLGRGSVFAWLLVLSPYLVIQLLRLAVVIIRTRRDVKPVTEPE